MMKAIGQTEAGDINVLKLVEIPKPKPGPRDLIVKIRAVATNPIDFKVRGRQPLLEVVKDPYPKILGWDASGVVDEVGSDCKFYKAGDEVYFSGSLTRNGANAEYCAVDERLVGRKPKNISFEEASALPLTVLTAWEALIEHMQLQPSKDNSNKVILITAGAGGVGSIAIQIAKKILKLKVIATASRPESVEYCKKMGADFVVHHNKSLAEEVRSLGINGVDYVLECFGLDAYYNQYVEILNPLGHICNIVDNNPVDTVKLWFKRGTLSYEFIFSRPMFGYDMEKHREILDEVATYVEQGIIVPRATVRLENMSKLKEAHTLQESGKTIGKIVVSANF